MCTATPRRARGASPPGGGLSTTSPRSFSCATPSGSTGWPPRRPGARLPRLRPSPSWLRETTERLRAALDADDPLFFDRLSREDAARTRVALEGAATRLANGVEARSLLNVRATRWGRRAAVTLLALYVLGSLAAARWLPKNVAREKPVHPSSTRRGDGKELVDGEIATVPGVYTNAEESPSVVIDLVDTYAVSEIRVKNRIDQSFDDSLPLVVEAAIEGGAFHPIARRDEHFAADPPWIIKANGEPVRLVRIKVLKRGYLALSEVEVYGKKLEPKAPHP